MSNGSDATPRLFTQPTRRGFLGLLGAGALLTFAGCESTASRPSVAKPTPQPLIPPRSAGSSALVPEKEVYFPPAVTASKAPVGATAKTTAAVSPARSLPAMPVVDPNAIIPRSFWAKSGPVLSRAEPMDGVELITFHHSGDPHKPFLENGLEETATHLENVRHYHVDDRGMADIGYHFAIDRMGRVWQLRSLKYEGQHVRPLKGTPNNPHNVGVVVLGNFDLQDPTPAQKERIKTFGKLLRTQYKLPMKQIFTHQELVSTECPGEGMQPYMVTLRKQGLI